MSNFNRSDFIKTVDGQKDFLSNTFQFYTFKRPFTKYRLQFEDYLRPDLISKKLFGTNQYWWIILKVNPEFQDVWNDMAITDDQEAEFPDAFKVGELINIPNILDIQEFYSFNKKTIDKL